MYEKKMYEKKILQKKVYAHQKIINQKRYFHNNKGMISMRNGNLLVRSIEPSETKDSGFYLPKSELEELQVGDGIIEETCHEDYPKGAKVFFHKVVPVDVR